MRNTTAIRAIEAAARRMAGPTAAIEVGRHSDFRIWQGALVRGAYVEVTAKDAVPYRLYAASYAELLDLIRSLQTTKES